VYCGCSAIIKTWFGVDNELILASSTSAISSISALHPFNFNELVLIQSFVASIFVILIPEFSSSSANFSPSAKNNLFFEFYMVDLELHNNTPWPFFD